MDQQLAAAGRVRLAVMAMSREMRLAREVSSASAVMKLGVTRAAMATLDVITMTMLVATTPTFEVILANIFKVPTFRVATCATWATTILTTMATTSCVVQAVSCAALSHHQASWDLSRVAVA